MAMYGQLGSNILAHQSFGNDFLQSLLELESQMYLWSPVLGTLLYNVLL